MQAGSYRYPILSRYMSSVVTLTSTQTSVEPRTAAVNATLLAFAAERRAAARRPAANPALQRSTDGTDRQTSRRYIDTAATCELCRQFNLFTRLAGLPCRLLDFSPE